MRKCKVKKTLRTLWVMFLYLTLWVFMTAVFVAINVWIWKFTEILKVNHSWLAALFLCSAICVDLLVLIPVLVSFENGGRAHENAITGTTEGWSTQLHVKAFRKIRKKMPRSPGYSVIDIPVQSSSLVPVMPDWR